MIEKQLQSKIINWLKKEQQNNKKLFWEKRQAGGYTYRIGIPDLYVVCNGIHIEIELKNPEDKVKYKSEQLYWKDKFEKLNINYLISNNFDEIIQFIKNNYKGGW